jgi:hypothetical protein
MYSHFYVIYGSDLPAPDASKLRIPCRARRLPSLQCCWYHSINWQKANEEAIAILENVSYVVCSDNHEYILQRIRNLRGAVLGKAADRIAGIEGTRSAVWSLLIREPIDPVERPISRSVPAYHSGRHRAKAMLDQGVPRVVVLAG